MGRRGLGILKGKQQSILLMMVKVKWIQLAGTWPWRAECGARSPIRGAGSGWGQQGWGCVEELSELPSVVPQKSSHGSL